MQAEYAAVAKSCLHAAETDRMSFPQIVGTLMQAGFEGYIVDFRRAAAAYYHANGDSVELETHRSAVPVAAMFSQAGIQAAIREAQQGVAGYTYAGFCDKVKASGCAGYIVSFSGRRAVYFGRTAECHTEHFPQ